MPGGIGVDAQRLLRIARAIEEQPGAQRQGPVVLGVEVGCRWNGQIQVQLLRDGARRPRRLRQLRSG